MPGATAKPLAFALLAAGVGTCLGCSSNSLTVDQYFSQLIPAECEPFKSLGGGQFAAYVVSECPSLAAAYLQPSIALLRSDLDAGRVLFNPSRAWICLTNLDAGIGGTGSLPPFRYFYEESSSYTTGSASPPPLPESACPGAFIGLVPNGGACFLQEECDAGFCTIYQGACPGVCTPFAQQGQSCVTDAGSEIWCQPVSAEDWPDELFCLQDQDGGATCLTRNVGSCGDAGETPCPASQTCVEGECVEVCGDAGACTFPAFCAEAASGQWECISPLASGATCTNDDLCLSSYPSYEVCAGLTWAGVDGGFVPTGSGICSPLADVGGNCLMPPAVSYADELETDCRLGLACVTGTCQIPPTSGPCLADSNEPCAPTTAYCIPSTNTCQVVGAVGAPCSLSLGGVECATGYCDPTGHCGGYCQPQ